MTILIEVVDGRSKYGNPKRQYHAVCSCGWADKWWPVVKSAAVSGGATHVRIAHGDK